MTNGNDSWFKYDKRIRWQHLVDSPRTLTIKSFKEIDAVFDEKDESGKKPVKPALCFIEEPRYMELNDTNRMLLVEWFGETPSACFGKKITLTSGKVRGGKRGIIIERADENTPTNSNPLPSKRAASSNNQLVIAQMYALAKEHNVADVQKLIKELMVQNHQDANAALAQLQARYAQPSVEINWDTATSDTLRAWATEHGIDKASVDSTLEECGGSIPEAHARMEKAVVK